MKVDCVRTRIKMCGITNEDDLILCQRAGADAVGFVLHEKSPRYVSPERVRDLLKLVYPWVCPVAVLTKLDVELMTTLKEWGIGAFQVYFDVDEALVRRFSGIKMIRAVGLSEVDRVDVDLYDAILLDAQDPVRFGGTGKVIDWGRAKEVVSELDVPVILAGGLRPENVAEAIRKVRPYAVDVASGLEREPGVKDEEKVVTFIRGVLRADSECWL